MPSPSHKGSDTGTGDLSRTRLVSRRAHKAFKRPDEQQQMEALLAIVQQQNKTTVTNTKFGEFDPSVELWSDYWARFETFTKANAIPDDRRAEIFLTNPSSAIYKLEAATCDFASIKDPLDEAMRTRFVCSIHNEAIIKALFKIKDDELTFTRAIEIAAEVEEATRVAKETLGSPDTDIHKVLKKKPPAKSSYNKPAAPHPNSKETGLSLIA
ncbi:transposon tf2-6 polyprotein [Plakobranchus ocellatus]|uniref:Transposon tf2-6 polyprotein n=1 Tax=Plakobranchus ocellatus TaxID=259542 RepID=A0AAV4A734_9GAST|nr:transposon tf2-6 polyprotein [Plakobranchus ocellatus]